MKKIKILQFPIANSNGGITHYALNNWKYMDKEKFICDFATMSKSLDFADDILKTGSKIHYISCYAEQNEEQFKKEINGILDEGYDVVHLHTKQWKSYLIEEICRERHIPKVIVHSHSTKCDNNNDDIRIKETEQHFKVRETLREDIATDYWACSKEAADWLYGGRISQDKIKIMPNAIELELFEYNSIWREDIRKELGINEDTLLLGNVGRLVYQKNQGFLLEVFSGLCKKFDNIALLIVGDGERRYELEQLSKRLKIEEKVFFLGAKSDVNKIYSAMDLFVLPSNFEGLGIVLIEAQMSGLLCVCSDQVPNDANMGGIVNFLPLKKNEWIQFLANTIRNNVKRIDCKEELVKQGYDIKNQIKKIEAAYEGE